MQIKDPVIIIEDDPDDQDVIKSLCGEIGICDNLLFFSNGSDVLHHLRTSTQKPFIILCDMNMPHMSGLELRDEMHKDESLRKKSIPFVFFSTAASKAQVTKAYDMTVQGFFIKENTFKETSETLDLIFKYWKKCRHPES